jgi:hypothetical protein
MITDTELTMFEAMLYAQEDESPSKAIENQEKRGQKMVVEYHRLPKSTSGCSNIHPKRDDLEFTKSQYEKMGIKIINDYDDLFWDVQLPSGWEIKATDHSMWNELLDDKGRKRASFFYKAAFYDRDAFINFDTRYTIHIDHTLDYSEVGYDMWVASPFVGLVKDCGTIIYTTPIQSSSEDYSERKEAECNINDKLENYMNKHYPNYKDVNAYWDE